MLKGRSPTQPTWKVEWAHAPHGTPLPRQRSGQLCDPLFGSARPANYRTKIAGGAVPGRRAEAKSS
eukprot:2970279-Amphidinium_carterae.1